MTNIGMFQCVDIGMWQSGCNVSPPICTEFGSRPLITGEFESVPKVSGELNSEPKLTGVFGTPACDD